MIRKKWKRESKLYSARNYTTNTKKILTMMGQAGKKCRRGGSKIREKRVNKNGFKGNAEKKKMVSKKNERPTDAKVKLRFLFAGNPCSADTWRGFSNVHP